MEPPLPPRDVPRAPGALDGGGAALAAARSWERSGRLALAALTALVVAALLSLLGWLAVGAAVDLAAHPAALAPSLRALARSARLGALATALALPPGLALGLWLARSVEDSRLSRSVRGAIDAAAALPAVLFGVAAWALLVASLGLRATTLPLALVLAALNLPGLSALCERSLRAVPHELEEASLALGASRSQTTLRVSLPLASRGIVAAAVLCLGRCFAECAPLLCLAPDDAYAPLTVTLWRSDIRAPEAAVGAALLAALALATSSLGRRLRTR